MGVAFKDLIISKEIKLEDLKSKIIILDAYNVLYQFLTTIRSRDGSLLTDSKGNTTSHLVGLFSRTTSLMQKGIKLIFVFDGKPPELKQKENKRRNFYRKTNRKSCTRKINRKAKPRNTKKRHSKENQKNNR